MKIAITNVTVIDGTGNAPIKNTNVLMENQKFFRVSDQPVPSDYKTIDGSGKTLIPGLIDAHKHIMNNGGSHMAVGLTLGGIKQNLATILAGGVTTILDLGSAEIALIAKYVPVSRPNIFNALSIVTRKGGYPAEYMPAKFYKLGAVRECETPAQISAAVDRLARLGVTAIKTAVVSQTFDGKPVEGWTDEQLKILTERAHFHNLPVCAHITFVDDYAQAARCGVDSVHHAAFDGVISDQVADEMIAAGIQFVPTLSLASLLTEGLENHWCDDEEFTAGLAEPLVENLKTFTKNYFACPPDRPVPGFFVSLPKKKWGQIADYQLENVAKYLARGGNIAMGTDSALGFSLHRTPVRELELLNQAGLSPINTIKAATHDAAQVFNQQHKYGAITPGKIADCLLIGGDISTDISQIKNIDTVIKAGKPLT